MVGKVSLGEFSGSGVAISQKVVLSAAHVFFNEETLDWYLNPFQWNIRHSPFNQSYDISARSYRHFSDYAEATRRFDDVPLDSTKGNSHEMFNLDAICLIYFEDVAFGGWAGWGSNRIDDDAFKMIVGYPVLNYSSFDPRRQTMHSTSLSGSPAEFIFQNYDDRLGFTTRLYLTEDLSAGSGNSGGPVFALLNFSSGIDWGVVGIFVGGFVGEQALAVSIDQAVEDLINSSISQSQTGPSDDHGNSRGTATTVELNHSILGNIETDGDLDYFSFELSSAGSITAYTMGNTDTLGTLQNNFGNVITTNDDSGSGSNFLITRELNPGIYYIEVSHFSNDDTGNYSLNVDFTETINLPDLVVDSVSVGSTSVIAGQMIRVDFDRSYKGSTDSSEFAHGLYLSTNEIISIGDTQLVDFAKASMSVDASEEFYFEVTIPIDTTPDTYYIGYILDTDKQIEESNETNNMGFVEIIVTGTVTDDNGQSHGDVEIVLRGFGDIAGEDIKHPNGNVFDQVLLTGQNITLQAKSGQIIRVSFMDEDGDIVQIELSGSGTVMVKLDPSTFLPPALPSRYNQDVIYVTGKPSVVIEGADSNTFFSIFTVGSINAVNQALFPEGQVYDAEADVTLVEVINSTGMGGMQLSNTVFSGNTGKVGVDVRGVPIAVRLTVGNIDADGDAVPHLLFGEGSFTVPAGNPGLRITGGDLAQTN